MDAASGLVTLKSMQATLLSLTTLSLTAHRFPESAKITDDIRCDFIIVGAGIAGSIVANRLSEDFNVTVCLFEAGGDPPLESLLPGLFPLQPLTKCDYNVTAVKDNFSSPYLIDAAIGLTCGKMLGGSSGLNHLLHARGAPADFKNWVMAVNDSKWDYENLLPYFIKSENLKDKNILNSPLGVYHGTSGYIELTTEPSEENVGILDAAAEMGNDIIPDINANLTLGYFEPMFTISSGDGVRQSGATAYLSPIKYRSNLFVFKNSRVVQILFDSNNTATGVLVNTSDNETARLYAQKEVIISAGAIHSPQLLMLSGIGPRKHLESLNISVILDLPVGQNYQDHNAVLVSYTLGATNTTPVSNPHLFPVSTTMGHVALDKSQNYPDYQTINMIFPSESSGFLQLCSNVFQYKNIICDTFFKAGNYKKSLIVALNALHRSSRGYILLKSTNPLDSPLVYPGTFANRTDLVNMGKYLADFSKINDTTYFQSVGAEFVDLSLPECANYTVGSDEFWQCYALQMSASLFHYCGTCSMGTVVDADLKVLGALRLRVVDGSVMPTLTSGNTNAPIAALAEKVSDLIKQDWNMET